MLKKIVSIVCITLLLFSILGLCFADAVYAGDTPVTTGGSFCDNPNCGTQNCMVWYIALCIADGLTWHLGY